MNTIQIPETIEEVKGRLGGIERLLTAKEWERAAIVYAWTYEPGSGRTIPGKMSDPTLYTVREFTNLGIQGLRGTNAVYRYRRAWEEAIRQHGVAPVSPGDEAELPKAPFPENTDLAGNVNERSIVERVTADPELAKAVVRQAIESSPEVSKSVEEAFVRKASRDHALKAKVDAAYSEYNVTPAMPNHGRIIPSAGIGVGSSLVVAVEGFRSDVLALADTLRSLEGDPQRTTLAHEEIDAIERAKRTLDGYADTFREAVGIRRDDVFARLMGS